MEQVRRRGVDRREIVLVGAPRQPRPHQAHPTLALRTHQAMVHRDPRAGRRRDDHEPGAHDVHDRVRRRDAQAPSPRSVEVRDQRPSRELQLDPWLVAVPHRELERAQQGQIRRRSQARPHRGVRRDLEVIEPFAGNGRTRRGRHVQRVRLERHRSHRPGEHRMSQARPQHEGQDQHRGERRRPRDAKAPGANRALPRASFRRSCAEGRLHASEDAGPRQVVEQVVRRQGAPPNQGPRPLALPTRGAGLEMMLHRRERHGVGSGSAVDEHLLDLPTKGPRHGRSRLPRARCR